VGLIVAAGQMRHDAYGAAASGRRMERGELVARFERWLAAKLDVPAAELVDVRSPSGAGTSSETVLATARWRADGHDHARDVVFRVHPDTFQLFMDPDFALQYKVIEVLHREQRVRAPEPLYYESDPAVIGLPFYVMSQFHGRVPVSSPPYNAAGFLHDATSAERRVAWTTAFEELCRIATVPLSSMPFLGLPERGATGLEQQLSYWRDSMSWSCGGEPLDVLLRLADWLDANVPADCPEGFAWGDARMGNMVFGDDFRLVGVLDWEQANNAGTRQDLGWWLFFDYFFSTGIGLKRLDGLGTRDETIGMWESIVGERAGDLTWYEVLAGFKVAILAVRTFVLLDSPDARSPRAIPVLGHTCELAGLPLGA
jgi:aminoglycoside phosphotransferase (APT) family kinase protein